MTNARIQHILSLIESYGFIYYNIGFFTATNDIENASTKSYECGKVFNSIKELLMEEKE